MIVPVVVGIKQEPFGKDVLVNVADRVEKAAVSRRRDWLDVDQERTHLDDVGRPLVSKCSGRVAADLHSRRGNEHALHAI